MSYKNQILIFILLLQLLTSAFAQTANVAKVILMRGKVTAKLPDGKIIEVKLDQPIAEGTVLQTAEKSFVKVIFIDKSQMNLGPNSEMAVDNFPKKEAGIITLIKGQLRSQVTKDYMEMEDKTKSKLYIKTKTAALGIRGTDFQVNFNPENQNTALITFEGKVAMAHIERNEREEKFNQNKLEKVVSSDKAVMVERGQISAVNLNVSERAMTPTLLGTKQIMALKENETGVKESTDSDKKQYRNPLPPGADSTIFSSVTATKAPVIETSTKSDPNGFFNNKTGEYKLPAGSIIDLTTVNIIPPPANAAFDVNTKTYIVPESFGKVDKTTGEYKAPEGLKLGHDGKFVVVDADAYIKSQAVNKEEKKEEKKEDKKEDKKEEKKEEKKDDKKDEKKDEVAGNKKIEGKEEAKSPANSANVTQSEEVKPLDNARAPASASEITSAPAPVAAPPAAPPVSIIIEVPKIYEARPEMAKFVDQYAVVKAPPVAPIITDTQRNIAQTQITKTETVRQTATDTGTTKTTTNVKIIFNAQ